MITTSRLQVTGVTGGPLRITGASLVNGAYELATAGGADYELQTERQTTMDNILFIPGLVDDPVNRIRRLLFPSSTPGGMWTSLRQNSLFQDTAGATPVTAFGQTTRRLSDLSGNGYHFTRDTEINAPTYHSGVVPLLRFDGTAQSMITPTMDFGGASSLSIYAAYFDRNNATAVLVESGTTSGSVSGRFGVFTPTSALNNYAARIRGTSDSQATSAGVFSRPDFVILAAQGGANQYTSLDRNGDIIGIAAGGSPAAIDNQQIRLGFRAGGSLYNNMDLAFLAIVTGRVRPDINDEVVSILSSLTRTIPRLQVRLARERLDAMYSWWQGPYLQDTALGTWACSTNDAAKNNVTNLDSGVNFELGADSKDDHIAPAILHQEGKLPIAAYHKRTGTALFWRKGTVSGDFSTLGAEQSKDTTVDVDYTRILYHEPTDSIYVFMRSESRRWVFFKSTDYGDTFANAVTFMDIGVSGQGYMTFNELDQDRVRFAAYTHPTSVLSIQDIYFGEINFATGEVTKADGTVVGTLTDDLPFALTDFDLCYDESADATATVSRLYAVGNGTVPEVAFAVWTDATDAEYRYVRWNGASWVMKTICPCGAVFGNTTTTGYYGGVTIPPRSAGHTFITSRENGGSWFVEKQVSTDGGDTFAATLIKRSDATKLIRPLFHEGSKYPLTYIEAYNYGSNFNVWQSRLVAVKNWT
jgi:hypothetical protein